MKFKVLKTKAGERVDLFLALRLKKYSRTKIQQAIKSGVVRVDGKSINSSYKLRHRNTITIDDKFFLDSNKLAKPKAEKIDFDIIYEDKNLLVINKPAGMVVHPAAGHKTGTLVNAILNYNKKISAAVHDKSDQLSLMRPGIIHRLDKDTSGILIVAKNKKSLILLSRQLQNKRIKKKYFALVFGWPPESGQIESYLTRDKKNRKKITEVGDSFGKKAISIYKSEKYFAATDGKNRVTLLEIEITTGRTHQIRVQMKGIGFPILGDQTYYSKESRQLSKKLGVKRQMLHAERIKFQLPKSNKFIELSAPLANDFQKIIKHLNEI